MKPHSLLRVSGVLVAPEDVVDCSPCSMGCHEALAVPVESKWKELEGLGWRS